MNDIARRIQQSVIQPVQMGIQGFQNPQAPSGDTAQRALDQVPYLRNIRGFNEGMFGQQAVNNPQVQFEGEIGLKGMKPLPPYLNPIKNQDAITIANLQRLIHVKKGEVPLPVHNAIMQLGQRYNINPKLDANQMIGELAGALEPHQKVTLKNLLDL